MSGTVITLLLAPKEKAEGKGRNVIKGRVPSLEGGEDV